MGYVAVSDIMTSMLGATAVRPECPRCGMEWVRHPLAPELRCLVNIQSGLQPPGLVLLAKCPGCELGVLAQERSGWRPIPDKQFYDLEARYELLAKAALRAGVITPDHDAWLRTGWTSDFIVARQHWLEASFGSPVPAGLSEHQVARALAFLSACLPPREMVLGIGAAKLKRRSDVLVLTTHAILFLIGDKKISMLHIPIDDIRGKPDPEGYASELTFRSERPVGPFENLSVHYKILDPTFAMAFGNYTARIVKSLIALRSGLKTCPDCAESVKTAARKCRYCGFRFESQA